MFFGYTFWGKICLSVFYLSNLKVTIFSKSGHTMCRVQILLLKFDSVCTCWSARFIWGQGSFSSRSDVFRQLHFHAQIYWKWYKLYNMFTLIIVGSKQNCAQSPLQAHFWSAPLNLFKTSLWQEFVAAFNGKNFGRCEIVASKFSSSTANCLLSMFRQFYLHSAAGKGFDAG